MAGRLGPSTVGSAPARGSAWRHAIAAFAAAATLAAACSGSPEATEPAVAPATDDPGSSSGDSGSTAVEPADQPALDAGAAGSPEGEGEGPAADGDAAGATNGGTQDAAEADASEGGASEGGASSQAAATGAADGGAADGGTGDEGEASGQAAAAGDAPEGAASTEGTVEAEAPEGDLETEPFVTGPIAPLIGSITTDLSLAQRRPLAVKVGNGDLKDRPQAGLAAADIVYEVLVEAGITRFLAVFHSEIPSRVGPVRSARSSDFDILADLATPYLVTSGGNSTVLREMRQAAREGTLVDIGAARMGAPYKRDRSRPSPHNLYFYYEDLGGGGPDALPGGLPDTPPEQLFDYSSQNPPGLPDAAGVTVAYTELHGGEVSHVWDNHLGGWVRIQDGTLHTTETAFGVGEIAPANVVVLSMSYGTSAADRRSPQAQSYGSGKALVLTAGSVREAFWGRSEGRIGYGFWDAGGNLVSLSSGATWLLLGNTSPRWPQAEVTVLTSSEATRLLADARAAADAEANAAIGS